jgi:hypothetical protein
MTEVSLSYFDTISPETFEAALFLAKTELPGIQKHILNPLVKHGLIGDYSQEALLGLLGLSYPLHSPHHLYQRSLTEDYFSEGEIQQLAVCYANPVFQKMMKALVQKPETLKENNHPHLEEVSKSAFILHPLFLRKTTRDFISAVETKFTDIETKLALSITNVEAGNVDVPHLIERLVKHNLSTHLNSEEIESLYQQFQDPVLRKRASAFSSAYTAKHFFSRVIAKDPRTSKQYRSLISSPNAFAPPIGIEQRSFLK